MVVKGMGVDVMRIDRIERTLERFGQRFLSRVFTPAEVEYCTSRRRVVQHLAGRFAAKEAVYKALGAYVNTGIRWREVEILRGRGGSPQVVLHGAMREAAERGGVQRILISITHEDNICIVVAIAEGP